MPTVRSPLEELECRSLYLAIRVGEQHLMCPTVEPDRRFSTHQSSKVNYEVNSQSNVHPHHLKN